MNGLTDRNRPHLYEWLHVLALENIQTIAWSGSFQTSSCHSEAVTVKKMITANTQHRVVLLRHIPRFVDVWMSNGQQPQLASLWSSNQQTTVMDMGYDVWMIVTSHDHALHNKQQQQQLLSYNKDNVNTSSPTVRWASGVKWYIHFLSPKWAESRQSGPPSLCLL